jgi:hypothetical protein
MANQPHRQAQQPGGAAAARRLDAGILPRGVLQFLTFKEYPFELGACRTPRLIHYKPSDLYLHEPVRAGSSAGLGKAAG